MKIMPMREPSFNDLILDHCPACYQTLKPQAVDCTFCGIILENYQRANTERKLKHTIGGLYHLSTDECLQLEKAWAKIEIVYYDQNLHNQFLHMCLRYKSLPYAVKKYQARLAEDSFDEIAMMMKTRILILAGETLPASPMIAGWVPPLLTQALLRLLIVGLVIGVCCGSVLMLISALTTDKFFFLAMGAFLTGACLLSAMSLLRLQRSF